ncbi:PREDICTED: uncharacterized protein LOC109212958 [Nicotiana attenuata]|uniref:Uncharacterized protein n=1 Tax=Nicotiana attenuata TaxID=49451 RepID=A0A1J6KHP7_NICAT|nr:PREDICTED: uncharacterized protein LOC109212958 [Nicotiana attenuata]OIT28188.1 hypothetical protein A4A49_19066 [Nicotiana attenuata]
MEVEDDLFFADLSKQISLLIMDDDEDENSSAYRPSPHSLQVFSQVIHPAIRTPYVNEQNSRRESKGTGVFIPRSSHPRRKNRQSRHFSSNTKIQGHTQRELNQVTYNNSLPHYYSLNPRKFS